MFSPFLLLASSLLKSDFSFLVYLRLWVGGVFGGSSGVCGCSVGFAVWSMLLELRCIMHLLPPLPGRWRLIGRRRGGRNTSPPSRFLLVGRLVGA
jgi:hypothetical protein